MLATLWVAPHLLLWFAPYVYCVSCCCFFVADLPAQCDNLVGWTWLDGGTGTKWDPPLDTRRRMVSTRRFQPAGLGFGRPWADYGRPRPDVV